MGWSALTAARMLQAGKGDTAFLNAKLVTANFYFDHLLPRYAGYLATIKSGSDSLMALDIEQF